MMFDGIDERDRESLDLDEDDLRSVARELALGNSSGMYATRRQNF